MQTKSRTGFKVAIMLEISRRHWLSQEAINSARERYTRISDADSRLIGRPLQYFKNKRILLWTRKPGLGDMVMNAICCYLLRQQFGLDVWYGCRFNSHDRFFPVLLKGVPCYKYQPDIQRYPLPKQASPRGYEGGLDHVGQMHPFDFIIDFRYHIHREYNAIFQSLMEFGVHELKIPCSGLPVHNLPEVSEYYDVIISPDCGGWKPVRGYRRSSELEAALRQRGFSVLNISRESGVGHILKIPELLAHAKAARLYIGVETGPTHLVSGVHKKAIVVQSGIHRSAFWNVYERTHVIESVWPCGGRKCHVRRHEQCEVREGVCIDRFSAKDIADLAVELLET